MNAITKNHPGGMVAISEVRRLTGSATDHPTTPVTGPFMVSSLQENNTFQHRLQILVSNILTRANRLRSVENILERVERIVQKATGVKDILIGFSEAPIQDENTISILLMGTYRFYICIHGVPQPYSSIAKNMLSQSRIQIQNAIKSFDENHRDELTQLYNRKLLTKKKRELDGKDISYIVFYLDIVGLGDANDAHGHRTGNTLLTDFSEALEGVFGGNKNNSIIRHGGDEFIIIVESDESKVGLDVLSQKANEYIQLLQEKIKVYQGRYPKGTYLDAKFGIAIRERNTFSKSSDIIAEADPKGKKNVPRLSRVSLENI